MDLGKCHSLLVEVIEAKDLKPFVTGRLESVYCAVSLKGTQSKKLTTYVCEETLEPRWIRQRFLFKLPANMARKDKVRAVKVRVSVMSKSVVDALNRPLGKADVELKTLQNEEEMHGWFPLRPPTGSTRASLGDITGSVKLRLQWIHTAKGLLRYNIRAFER